MTPTDPAPTPRPGRKKGERPSGNPPPPDAAPFYGRRKGKTLRSHHAGLMDELLPKVELGSNQKIADVPALFARTPREVWLEVGFGGGEHLAQRADEHRDVGFIGCEPFVNGVAKALALIDEKGLDNIRVCPGDAGRMIDALPDACLARAYILYPDPWPKRRQKKRRFISDDMLKRLARVLKPGAELRFATDIDDYAGWTLARIARSTDFVWPAQKADDWRIPWEGWRSTRYEEKARREGRPSGYFTFVRN